MAVVPKQNGLEILRKLIPLNTLPAESLDRLFDVAVFEKHSKGDRLFKEGDENLQRIYLLSGSLSIKSGKNEVDAISSSSNMARYPIAHQSPRKFTVLAKTKIETVSVDNEFLADLFAGVEDAAYEVNVFEEQVVDDDWMSQLLQSRAFQQIPAANIQNVMMRMEEVRTLAGDVVISQGDEGDYFYLIHKGECLVSLSEDGGESKEVARLGPGDSFGEDALLSDKPRGSTVTMLTNGVLIRLDKQDFVDYVKHPLAGTIGYGEAQALVGKGAVWLDVRPTAEHLAGRVPGSISIPFNNLRRRFDELSSDQRYIVYCKNGQVSTTAAYLLLDHGIEASILKGGLESVDTEQLESAGADEGAEIIQLHTDQNGVPGELVSGGGDNSKEVELLKARLARMEGIAKEQNLTARKIKVVLDQTKEKLDEVEKQNSAANDEKRRLESELSQTLKKLEAQNSAEEARALLEARLVDLQKELDESEEGRLSLEARTSSQESMLKVQAQEHDELTALKIELETLGGALEAADQSDRETQEEVKKLEDECDSQRDEVEHLSGLLEQEATRRESEVSELQTQLTTAAEQAESLQVDLSEREQSGSEQQQRLEQEKRELDEQLTILREEQEILKGQKKAATEQTESLQVDLSEREQSGSEQQQRLEQEKRELDEQLTTLREEQETLKGQLKAATEQTESLQVDLSEREQSGSEQQQRLEQEKRELDEQLTTLREEQETLKGQLKAATEQTESLQSDLVEHEQSGDEEQQRLEQEKGELVEQLATLREEQQSLKGELTEREQSVGEQQQRLERERGELKEQLVTLQEEQETLKEALKTATEQTESLQSELAEQEQSGDEDLQRLEQEKGELEAQLTTLREEEASRLAEGESTLVDWQRQIDSLQKKLAESEASKQRLEEQSTSREGELALRESEHEELIVLKKELEEIGSALDEVGASDKEAREAIEALETERDNQRQELELLEGALAQASVLQSRLDEVVEEKAVVEQEAHRLSGEVEELRSIMQQYAEQIEAAQQGGGAEEVTALQAELELVREQAEEDMAQLRQALESAEEELAAKPAELEGGSSDDQVVMLQLELEEARAKIRESELTGSVEATESEAVRQEMDSLQSSLDERRRELEKSRKDSLLLEERIEEGNSEIDRLKLALEASQDDMDEAEFSRNEAQEAKKQVEEALYKVQQKIESDRPVDGLTDERLASKKQVLDIESTSPLKSLMVSGLVGAVAAFGLVEIFSIMSGGGEIIGRILQQEKPPVQVEMPANTPLQTVPGSVPLQSQPVAKRPVQEKPQVSSTEVPQTAPAGKFVQPEVKPAVPVIKETATGTLIQDRLTGGGRAPDMVYIRGGEFIMGSDRSQLASEERPSHKVSVGSFAIGRYEVTFDEYALFVRATDRKLPDDLGWGRGRRPVMNVSWDDASAYAAWLSRRTGKGYRLPTEAEWEYAAAAGSDTTYWWGFQIGENRANCFNCGSPWDHKSTAVVGRFEANPFGLHNSAGNVMEWVADCYHGNYQGAPVDGSAWVDAGCRERVVRGGAFNKPGDSLRTTKRGHHDADAKLFVVGFRLARDL
ncbi:MAG: SUMF1/EgtB/PvdO family nonheme iron enzyme [Candidatus Sedimenticola sp. (ex Thyasira tokunagai)]